jgi:hypothetical protein
MVNVKKEDIQKLEKSVSGMRAFKSRRLQEVV